MRVELTYTGQVALPPEPVSLPASKSIAARFLTLRALADACTRILNLPDCDDTSDLNRAIADLHLRKSVTQIRQGAASLRFFIALAAAYPDVDMRVDCHPSLLGRPLAPLIDALGKIFSGFEAVRRGNSLYLSHRHPDPVDDSVIRIDIDTSLTSQFLSALMMASLRAPVPVSLSFSDPVSSPYVSMTARAMSLFGAQFECRSHEITVYPSRLDPPQQLTVETDWSSAAFVYQTAMLRPDVTIRIRDISLSSSQGDAAVAGIFSRFGVSTVSDGPDILVRASADAIRRLQKCGKPVQIDLSDTPDIVPPLAVALALSGIGFRFTGIGHLRVKESDRIHRITAAMAQIGTVIVPGSDSISFSGETCEAPLSPVIDPALDHRIAMAMAPAVIKSGRLAVSCAQCVAKSFPLFWKTLPPLFPADVKEISEDI